MSLILYKVLLVYFKIIFSMKINAASILFFDCVSKKDFDFDFSESVVRAVYSYEG